VKKVIVGLAIGALALTGCSSSNSLKQTGPTVAPTLSTPKDTTKAKNLVATTDAKAGDARKLAAEVAKAKAAHLAHVSAVAHTQALAKAKAADYVRAVVVERAHRRAVASAAAKKTARRHDTSTPCSAQAGQAAMAGVIIRQCTQAEEFAQRDAWLATHPGYVPCGVTGAVCPVSTPGPGND
jgi:hypothetical protein